jgi:type IV pilus assembly protein PilV
MNKHSTHQAGASLIEVLIAILILSFGMLSVGSMLSFSIQMPKLSAYRATATHLAASQVERIRANPEGFAAGNYSAALNAASSWSFTSIALSASCTYGGTQCTPATLAATDINEFRNIVRRELPGGDIIIKCDPAACASTAYGQLWVLWQEPRGVADLDASSTDNCPPESTKSSPPPRCLYIRFKVQ